ncbi:MAG TPA: hypothetical protein VKU44_04540 [Terriglobia bacterium]|nr:hypothetical protein [Terriglobia bacterium]
MKRMLSVLSLALFVFLVVTPLVAQDAPAAGDEAAKPAKKEQKVKYDTSKPETLSGTVALVKADDKLVIVTSAAGVPYDFKVTAATKIKIGDQKGKIDDLAGATNKQASVSYLPTRTGNIAKSIDVTQ